MFNQELIFVLLIYIVYSTISAEKEVIGVISKLECSNDTQLCKDVVCSLKPINRSVTYMKIGYNLTVKMNALIVCRYIVYNNKSIY